MVAALSGFVASSFASERENRDESTETFCTYRQLVFQLPRARLQSARRLLVSLPSILEDRNENFDRIDCVILLPDSFVVLSAAASASCFSTASESVVDGSDFDASSFSLSSADGAAKRRCFSPQHGRSL